MSFEYERDTRTSYQNDAIAATYHQAFTENNGLLGVRFRIVARAERNSISRLLSQIPHGTVLDIPTGTGKLAPVFARLGSRVWACDISENMLNIARSEFMRSKCKHVDFSVQDAADLGQFSGHQFDTVVCLRLMHRVPADIRRKMLAEFARVAPFAVVSFGVENGYHKVRRLIRSATLGGGSDKLCYGTLADVRNEIRPWFNIERNLWIAPVISQEMVFLLKSKERV